MTVIAVSTIAAATALILMGKSIGDLLAVIGVASVPVLGVFGAQLHSTVTETKTNTNGNLSAMRDALIRIAEARTPAAAAAAETDPAAVGSPDVAAVTMGGIAGGQ